ncbi:hypothetical protein AJ80_02646 [Polytolypa hystricis UAMH7299]|uniref:Calpain catalytic domain-containing protein n=1 Tax=Polytolypa hystricis (strain UAMH7299) TaxID=1447883 RepID=A0A2B7YPX6_POLH7|nr:hypothetical protein AJ80_02646 [Polytolypa hystricis UAMH7299]
MSNPAPNLKALEAQAAKAEKNAATATTQTKALESAINAAELYMNALKLAGSSTDRRRLDARCKELLTRAENIKKAPTWPLNISRTVITESTASRPEPVSSRALSNREQIILLETSRLHGCVFPPWKAAPALEEFEQPDNGELFTDSSELHFSPLQRNIFGGWKRLSELLSDEGSGHVDPVMETTSSVDLVQDITTDCSVVASLCAVISQVERGYSKQSALIKIYPSDKETGVPLLSRSGKYIFCMYFNGCYRKVIIDDRLPSSKTSRSIFVIDRNNPALLWPALVEKAYLKVRGGYDFPGSNSGTDIWVLTGWIPEQIFLHHDDSSSYELWQRLFNAFLKGDVLLTIGTGSLTEDEENELGLVSTHDYAILDMKEEDGHRQLLVKNPWAAGVGWKGAEQPTIDTSEERSSLSGSPHRSPLAPGTFWMDFGRSLQNFENLYLNWNPTFFSYRQDIHFNWDLASANSSIGCFVGNPQFSVASKNGGLVWLLLSKHFRTSDYTRSSDQLVESSPGHDGPGFISIYLFRNNGQRVFLSDGALRRGPYIDSPNTLMRFEMPPNTTYTVVAAEQSLPRSAHNLALSGFSTSPLTISRAAEMYGHAQKFHSAWTPSTAGGNTGSERYPSNPQFSIKITETCDVSVLLESANADFATHVKIIWSNGKRVGSVLSRDIVSDSGDYRPSCSLARADNMIKGVYTIVCSTFAPDQLGKFTLWIKTTKPCTVKPLPAESAGRLSVSSGIGTFSPGTDRIVAPLSAPRLTRIKLIARHKGSRIGDRTVAPSPILMTIELGRGPYKEILATSGDGEFSDAIAGICIEDFDLQPRFEHRHGIWIAVERVGGPSGQVEDTIQLEILSEERVSIGPWRDSDG